MGQFYAPGGHNKKNISLCRSASECLCLLKEQIRRKMFLMFSTNNPNLDKPTQFLNSPKLPVVIKSIQKWIFWLFI